MGHDGAEKGGVMTSTQHQPTQAIPVRAALLVGVVLVWIVVALLHPQGEGEVYDALDDQVGMWLTVHLAQPVLALGVAAGFWMLLANRTGTAATVARVALPVWLVSFAMFDSVTGIATGLAIHHANGLDGAEQQGASSTVQYLADNNVTADFSPVWFVQAATLLIVVIATALALRSAGASRAVFISLLIGCLLVFHQGPAAAVGLAGLAVAFFLADREGLFIRGDKSLPAA
jgi:hypothetical protein